MRKILLASAAIAALAIPASASASHDGVTCNYTASQDTAIPVGSNVVVYADTTGNDGGTSGTAAAAAGVCVNGLNLNYGVGTFDGGTVEAGAKPAAPATNQAYVVVDGDDNNTDPTGSNQSRGYVGLSNYETGSHEPCGPADTGTGSNSGGCLSIRTSSSSPPIISLPVPLIICGNTTGSTWDDSARDGCTVA